MNLTIETGIEFFGDDFWLTAEVEITDMGYAPTYDDPGADPEWDAVSIYLERDTPNGLGPAFKATGQLFQAIIRNDWLVYKINQAVGESVAEFRWERRQRRRRAF